jgi:phosphoribosylanthranilate isomerase
MSLFVKICGITDVVSARAAVEAGADAIGLVLTTSPRRVTPGTATAIASEVPPEMLKVAVFRETTTDEVRRELGPFVPDLVQADHRSAVAIDGIGFLPVFRDGADAPPPGSLFLYEGPESGVGRMVDQERAAVMARRGRMILAGGLDAGNVGRVVATVRPFGVDVSSGVETSPGRKDLSMIEEFVAAAREAAGEVVAP